MNDLLLLIVVFLGFGVIGLHLEQRQDYQIKLQSKQQQIDSLQHVIQKKDSIFKDHMKQCSFISKSQLDTNKFGDVFIKEPNYLTYKNY